MDLNWAFVRQYFLSQFRNARLVGLFLNGNSTILMFFLLQKNSKVRGWEHLYFNISSHYFLLAYVYHQQSDFSHLMLSSWI